MVLLGSAVPLRAYGVRSRRTSALREQLGLVLGTKSKIGDGSDLGTCCARVTSVADFRLHVSVDLQLFPQLSPFRRPVGALWEPHWRPCKVKVMLAYSHSLYYDHQGFRPFSPDHREAARSVGPAAARVQVHCDLQNSVYMRSRDRVHGGHVGSKFIIVLLLGNVAMGQAAYMG